MRIIYDEYGQTGNRFFSYLDSIGWALVNKKKVYILFPEAILKDYDNFRNSEYISLPLWNSSNLTQRIARRCLYYNPIVRWFYGTEIAWQWGFRNGWSMIEDADYYPKVRDEVIKTFRPNKDITEPIDCQFAEIKNKGTIIVGVHLRKKDYKTFLGGKYYFSDEDYVNFMHQIKNLHEGKHVCFYLATNEKLSADYRKSFDIVDTLVPTVSGDLYALSQCDLILGPPSTFSRWASFVGKVPMCILYNRDTRLEKDDFSTLVAHHWFENGTRMRKIQTNVVSARKIPEELKNKLLVSVVVPNYNHAKYLPERLDAIFNQTYTNYEVIILDDCSTDNSREIIDKYRNNPHISHIIINEKNGGSPFPQWKKGIELAKGNLIWIAESDDKTAPSFLEKHVLRFLENPQLSLAFSRSWLFNDEGKTMTMDTEGLKENIYDGKEFIRRFMSQGCVMLNASSCVFSKYAFCKIEDRYSSFKASGDYMFWTEICEQGDVAVVEERLNYFRNHHGNNTTSKSFDLGINQMERKIILDYMLNNGYISSKQYKTFKRQYLRKYVFEFLSDKNLKKEIYQHWEFSRLEQFMLRLNAWTKKISKIL